MSIVNVELIVTVKGSDHDGYCSGAECHDIDEIEIIYGRMSLYYYEKYHTRFIGVYDKHTGCSSVTNGCGSGYCLGNPYKIYTCIGYKISNNICKYSFFNFYNNGKDISIGHYRDYNTNTYDDCLDMYAMGNTYYIKNLIPFEYQWYKMVDIDVYTNITRL